MTFQRGVAVSCLRMSLVRLCAMWRVTACRCAARCCCGSSAIVRWERHHLLLLLLLCIRFRGNNHNCPMRRRQTTSRMHIHHRFCRPIPSTFFHQYWYHWKHLQELLPCLSLHYGGYPYTNEHLILPQPGGTLTIPESSCRGLKCLPLCHGEVKMLLQHHSSSTQEESVGVAAQNAKC